MDNDAIQYLQLYDKLNPQRLQHTPLPVTVAMLSEMLCCTPRNAKFVLRRLESRHWIVWQPGRGRGHISQLEFLYPVADIVEVRLRQLLDKDRVKEALELIGTLETEEPIRERLWNVLHVYLGMHSEQEESSVQDVLRMIRYRPLEKLDTASVFTAFETFVLRQIQDTLLAYDAASRSFLPRLAYQWENNEDHTSWTFYLRKGIRFHDGALLTARDVRYTWQRMCEKESSMLWLYRDIREVEQNGDHIVTFHLHRSNLFFLHLMTNVYMAILPAHIEQEQSLIGSGPFRISELTASKLSLLAFDDYYGLRPVLDRVDVWFMPEQGHMGRLYQLSERDDQMASRQINHPVLGCRYLRFDFRTPGIQHHPKFRECIRHLYDGETMMRELGGDRIAVAYSLLPWKSADYQPLRKSSLAEAKRLLWESGYDGIELGLSFMDKKEERIEALWMQQQAARIGLRLQLLPCTKAYGTMLYGRDRGEIMLGMEILEDDWEWDMINFFANEGNYLYHALNSGQQKRLKGMLEGIMQLEQGQRESVLDRVEQMMRDENWIIYGNHLNQRAYFNRNLYGLHIESFGFPNLSALWIRKK
ncbi:ABC transporter substrate-binding protein [Paenibacillus sp. Z6-24]